MGGEKEEEEENFVPVPSSTTLGDEEEDGGGGTAASERTADAMVEKAGTEKSDVGRDRGKPVKWKDGNVRLRRRFLRGGIRIPRHWFRFSLEGEEETEVWVVVMVVVLEGRLDIKENWFAGGGAVENEVACGIPKKGTSRVFSVTATASGGGGSFFFPLSSGVRRIITSSSSCRGRGNGRVGVAIRCSFAFFFSAFVFFISFASFFRWR